MLCAAGQSRRRRIRPQANSRCPRSRIPANMNWFERLTGFEESTYDKTKKQLEIDGTTLRSKAKGKNYNVGMFEMASLADLRAREAAGTGAAGKLCGAEPAVAAVRTAGARRGLRVDDDGSGAQRPARNVAHRPAHPAGRGRARQRARMDHHTAVKRGLVRRRASTWMCGWSATTRRRQRSGRWCMLRSDGCRKTTAPSSSRGALTSDHAWTC